MSDVESNNNKRARDESFESPEAKRLREDLFLDILDGDGDSGDRDPTAQDLVLVMKSFEEEIGLPPVASAPLAESAQPELGFLFEASDDELGLPPTSTAGEGKTKTEFDADEPFEGGLGCQIWGYDDGIFGGAMIRTEELDGGGDDGVFFDGGLFDYSDVVSGPSDLGDLSWRTDTMPAV